MLQAYQTVDTVSAAVTTKVKGQGFLPINLTKNRSLNMSDLSSFFYYTEINSKTKYMMLDTAGWFYIASK